MIRVSLVIPTYNRLARLKRVLEALEAQTYPASQFEVIVVSDGSTDGTHEYLENLQSPLRIRLFIQPNSGPASARNNGIRAAQGDYLLFLDDDVIPVPHLIAEHMQLQAGRTDLVVLGPMLTPSDCHLSPWVAWEQKMLEKQYAAMQEGVWAATARQFYTGNTSLLRELILSVGGFDERFRRAEDIELAYRLEQHEVDFVFAMTAEAYHYAERSFTSWLQIPYAYGRYDVVFSRELKPSLRSFIAEGFRERHLLTRMAVWFCLDHPLQSQILQTMAKKAADISARWSLQKIVMAAYSAIFNVRYYQGIADELGGRTSFINLQKSNE
jgi:glycosyltransferase involved in cell wall biosynthesis